jgi:hypothetical protein
MKRLILAALVFCTIIGLSVSVSAQIVIHIPAPPVIIIGPPMIRVYSAPPPPVPYYLIPDVPYPDRYNSYRTGSYEDYYLPPSPPPPPGLYSPYGDYHYHYHR